MQPPPSTSSTPTPVSSSPPAPTPNHAGNAISSCNKYAATQGGDYCSVSPPLHLAPPCLAWDQAPSNIPLLVYSSSPSATVSVRQTCILGTAFSGATGRGARTSSGQGIITALGFQADEVRCMICISSVINKDTKSGLPPSTV